MSTRGGNWVSKSSKKEPTHQPRAYMSMLKREGRFRLLRSKLSKDARIWHNCDQYGDCELVKNRTIWEVMYGESWKRNQEGGFDLRWRCSMCGEESPEGLTGLYIMLDWDRATKEIAEWTQWEAEYRDIPF